MRLSGSPKTPSCIQRYAAAMTRTAQDIWAEALRTAKVVRGAQLQLIPGLEQRVLANQLTGDDASALVPLVSDAQILVGLLEQLEARGIEVRDPAEPDD